MDQYTSTMMMMTVPVIYVQDLRSASERVGERVGKHRADLEH